jgi:hypothetical protein
MNLLLLKNKTTVRFYMMLLIITPQNVNIGFSTGMRTSSGSCYERRDPHLCSAVVSNDLHCKFFYILFSIRETEGEASMRVQGTTSSNSRPYDLDSLVWNKEHTSNSQVYHLSSKQCSESGSTGSTCFFGLPDPDPLVRGMHPDPAPDPDPSMIMQK